MKLLLPDDPRLRQVCEPVSEDEFYPNPLLIDILGEMQSFLETCPNALGLAAPQIGIMKRIFIIKIGNKSKEYINPEIIGGGQRIEAREEGCLSIPGYFRTVVRLSSIRVQSVNQLGALREEELTGIWAQCFQHELDHLDGKLISDF